MKFKQIIVLPALAISFSIFSSEELSSLFGVNSVYVTYKSVTYKNEDEGYFGESEKVGEKVKTFKVRRGITWNKRNNREKPDDPKAIDEDLKFNNYTDSEGNAIVDTTEINEDITVFSNYTIKDLTHDWNDATPLQLATIAKNEGFEGTKTWFGVSTFVGMKKEFKYGDRQINATVIGENVDKITDTSDKAVFTFEFDECIPSIPFDIASKNVNNYENSYLRYYLNNISINNFTKGFKKAVKYVDKTSNIGEGTSSDPSFGKTKVISDRLFAISLSEMNASKYNELRKDQKSTYVYPEEIDNEGKCYEYYNKDKSNLPSLLKKSLGKDEYVKYWVRSPELQTYSFSWFINPTSDNKYEIGAPEEIYYKEQAPKSVSDSLAVAPCFCI